MTSKISFKTFPLGRSWSGEITSQHSVNMTANHKYPLPSCCDDFPRIDFSKISLPQIVFSWTDTTFLLCALYILLCPAFWILVCCLENRKRWLSRLFCDAAYVACTVTACMAIILGLLRNWAFRDVLYTYPKWNALQENWILWIGHSLFIIGLCLIVTSVLRLGFYGVYFGVYFGIELPPKIYRFPYSVMDHPLYWGTFLLAIGASLFQASQAALVLSILLGAMYWLTVVFESPIMNAIHARMKVTQGTQTDTDDFISKEDTSSVQAATGNSSSPSKSPKNRKAKKSPVKVESIGKSESKKDM